jgi:hypothetical protein
VLIFLLFRPSYIEQNRDPLTFLSSSKFNKDASHITRVFDLTYFWRSQRSNFGNFYDLLQHLNYLTDLHQIFIMNTSNIRIHRILPVFFIWPTFQGHRSQTFKFLQYLFAHYHSQVCNLTRLQAACPQPLPCNELSHYHTIFGATPPIADRLRARARFHKNPVPFLIPRKVSIDA